MGVKHLYQKRGWWYYQPPTPENGPRPKAVALRTKDEVQAINDVTDMQWNGMVVAAETKDTLAELLPRYYAAKLDHRKSTTLGRKQILDAFMTRMGNPKIKDVTKDLILEWRTLLATKGGTEKSSRAVSQTTMVSYLITLRAFLNWCVEEKILRVNPAKGMGKQSTVRKTRRQEFLSIARRDRLLSEPCEYSIKLVLLLGFFAGLRPGEVQVINPEWIFIAKDWSYGSIRIQPVQIELTNGTKVMWAPKTERGHRTIPMHARLIEFFKEHGVKSPFLLAPQKTVFPNMDKKSRRYDPKKALHNHANKCGIAKINSHMLRHSFATHLAEAGATIVEIAGLLGDTVKVTEETYVGFSPNFKGSLSNL